MLTRNVAARPDLHPQRIVAARSLDQHAEAGVREARARVTRGGLHHLPVAARHQHLGHGLAQRLALGDSNSGRMPGNGRIVRRNFSRYRAPCAARISSFNLRVLLPRSK
jgi:hypothetical protein